MAKIEEGRAEYERAVLEAGDTRLIAVPVDDITGDFMTVLAGEGVAEAANRKLHSFHHRHVMDGRRILSALEVFSSRLVGQGLANEWPGFLGTIYLDAAIMPENVHRPGQPQRIGLQVMSILDDGEILPDAFITEIGIRSQVSPHDVLPRGQNVSPELAYTANGIVAWREAAVAANMTTIATER